MKSSVPLLELNIKSPIERERDSSYFILISLETSFGKNIRDFSHSNNSIVFLHAFLHSDLTT